jgi:hypothetical protein
MNRWRPLRTARFRWAVDNRGPSLGGREVTHNETPHCLSLLQPQCGDRNRGWMEPGREQLRPTHPAAAEQVLVIYDDATSGTGALLADLEERGVTAGRSSHHPHRMDR